MHFRKRPDTEPAMIRENRNSTTRCLNFFGAFAVFSAWSALPNRSIWPFSKPIALACLMVLLVGCASDRRADIVGTGVQSSAQAGADEAPNATYVAILDAAQAKQDQGDFAAAVTLYRNALGANPRGLEAQIGMGQALLLGGAAGEAVEGFRSALALDSDNIEARRGLANALTTLGEPTLAIPHYQRVLEQSPADYRGYLGLGAAYDLLGDHAAAQAIYGAGLAEAPKTPDLIHNLALSETLAGTVEEGIKRLRSLLRDPSAEALDADVRVQYRQTLVMALALGGREDEARAVATLDLDPASVERNLAYFKTLRGIKDPAIRLQSIRAFIAQGAPKP